MGQDSVPNIWRRVCTRLISTYINRHILNEVTLKMFLDFKTCSTVYHIIAGHHRVGSRVCNEVFPVFKANKHPNSTCDDPPQTQTHRYEVSTSSINNAVYEIGVFLVRNLFTRSSPLHICIYICNYYALQVFIVATFHLTLKCVTSNCLSSVKPRKIFLLHLHHKQYNLQGL
jgi:hypothetical protein